MLNRTRKFTIISATALLAASIGSSHVIAQDYDEEAARIAQSPVADAMVGGEFIDFTPNIKFERATVRISGPKGYSATVQIPAGTPAITADLIFDAAPAPVGDLALEAYTSEVDGSWISLPDGEYRYELVMISGDRIVGRHTGDFRVEGGKAMDGNKSQSNAHAPTTLFQRIAGAALDLLIPSASAQVLTTDNYLDVADASANNQTYIRYANDNVTSSDYWRVGNASSDYRWARGFLGTADIMTLRDVGSGRLGIGTTAPADILHAAYDSSGIAALRVENSTTGYRLYTGSSTGFAIQQIKPSTALPFRIEPEAPTGSIHVAETGDVGIGTGAPFSDLTVNGSIGFTDGTTPLLLNSETCCSNGSRMIWAHSPGLFSDWGIYYDDSSDDMHIQSSSGNKQVTFDFSGNMGIGATSPSAKLHVSASDGSANILLEETQAIATNDMFTMRNNGNPGFLMENTDSSAAWQFRLGGSGSTEQFTINKTSVAGPELSVLANGNIRIKGAYLTGSSRSLKESITKTKPEDVLSKLQQLPLYEWTYKTSPSSRHIGPMAEEYFEVFGLAGEGTGLAASDLASIALAGIQAIDAKAERLEKENNSLKKRLEVLEATLVNKH